MLLSRIGVRLATSVTDTDSIFWVLSFFAYNTPKRCDLTQKHPKNVIWQGMHNRKCYEVTTFCQLGTSWHDHFQHRVPLSFICPVILLFVCVFDSKRLSFTLNSISLFWTRKGSSCWFDSWNCSQYSLATQRLSKLSRFSTLQISCLFGRIPRLLTSILFANAQRKEQSG